MNHYLNVHFVLQVRIPFLHVDLLHSYDILRQRLRDDARKANGNGPRVMIVGAVCSKF